MQKIVVVFLALVLIVVAGCSATDSLNDKIYLKNLYIYDDGVWSLATAEMGAQGPQGPQGAQGSQGPAGNNGTNFYDVFTDFMPIGAPGYLTSSSASADANYHKATGELLFASTGTTSTSYGEWYVNTMQQASRVQVSGKVVTIRSMIIIQGDSGAGYSPMTNALRYWLFRASYSATISETDNCFGFKINNGDLYVLQGNGSNNYLVDTGVDVSAETWYPIKIEVSDSDIKYYFNGNLVDTVSTYMPTGAQRFTMYMKTLEAHWKWFGSTGILISFPY